VVTAGIVLVGFFDTNNVAQGETNDNTTANQQVIGIALILGQSIMSVVQDLTEEVFMQEAAFPPALLVVSFIRYVCICNTMLSIFYVQLTDKFSLVSRVWKGRTA
jgi:hypothetical protein